MTLNVRLSKEEICVSDFMPALKLPNIMPLPGDQATSPPGAEPYHKIDN